MTHLHTYIHRICWQNRETLSEQVLLKFNIQRSIFHINYRQSGQEHMHPEGLARNASCKEF